MLWTLRHGAALWAIALLLAVPATIRTVYMYAHLRSEIEELLPRDAPSVKALDEMRARSPGLAFLGVVILADDARELPAAERFLDDLAKRVRTYPADLVKDVRADRHEEETFFDAHAALYVDLADLQEIRRRIQVRRDYEVEKESGGMLDDDAPPPAVDIADIESKYDTRIAKESRGHYTSAKDRTTMLFVEAGNFSTGAEKARELLGKVKGDVATLDLPSYGRGLRIGYASDIAINVEELDALEDDLSLSSIVVVVAVIAVIALYYHWWKSIPILMAPLLVATVYAFGIASLPPMHVTELNSNTAFLGSIIVGNGINVGLILLARYREERLRGLSVEEALVRGVWGARLGTLAAAAAASASYGSLVVTEFRGFRQFGCIGGIGMITSWVTAFVLIPPLVKWLDREGAPSRQAALGHGRLMSRILRLVERGAPVIVLLSSLLVIASAFEARKFDSSRLEYDFQKLRRADTWKDGEGFWGRKMDALLGHYLTPTILLLDTAPQADAVAAEVKASSSQGLLAPMVARVISVDDVLPRDQAAKIEEVARIRKLLTPKIRSLIPEDKRDEIDRLLGERGPEPVVAAGIPGSLTMGLRERDGTMGRSVLVYPRPSDALWKAESIHLFVRTLRDLARPGAVAGSIPLSSDIIASIARDAPLASAISLLGVIAVVLVVLRGRRACLYVIGSLLVGVLWLVGLVMLLGIKINFSNFVAFPITFGIGVDYSVNVITRYVQDGERDVAGAIRSTGGAVALCSLTTIIGYSSLLLAKNQALFLFGLVAVLGEVACLTAAVVALPAFLLFLQRRRQNIRPSET